MKKYTAYDLPAFPVKEHHVALYLHSIGQHLEFKSAAEEAVNALSWVHSLMGLESPMEKPTVQATLQGLKRMLAKPVLKRKPVNTEMLADMIQDADKQPLLSNLRITTFNLLTFAGFLRFDEAIHIRACDMEFSAGMVKILLPRSKTDQFRQGQEVLIARTNTPACSVAILKHYIAVAEIIVSSKSFLFRNMYKTACGEKLRPLGPLSYTTVFQEEVGRSGIPSGWFWPP